MKATIRIPTTQYGFIELEAELDSAEEAIMAHNDILKLYAGGEGLSQKDFNTLLDGYLKEGRILSDEYAKCSPEQTNIIQAIKRSLNRIKYHGESNDIEG